MSTCRPPFGEADSVETDRRLVWAEKDFNPNIDRT